MFPGVNFRLEVVPECRSSQEVLLLKRGQPFFHGSAVLALKQTAGYGRRGREWSSLEGNLALSLGLEIPGPPEALALLPFLAGLALHEICGRYVPESCDLRLKWPNDLYLDGKKLSGLISQARQYDKGSEVVLGIGVNLKSAPESLDAIALNKYGKAPSPQEFAKALIAELENVLAQNLSFQEIRKGWEQRALLSDKPLWVVGEAEAVVPLQLLPTGELLVRDKGATERKLSSEDVSLRYNKS